MRFQQATGRRNPPSRSDSVDIYLRENLDVWNSAWKSMGKSQNIFSLWCPLTPKPLDLITLKCVIFTPKHARQISFWLLNNFEESCRGERIALDREEVKKGQNNFLESHV